MSEQVSIDGGHMVRFTFKSAQGDGLSIYPRLQFYFDVLWKRAQGRPENVAISDIMGDLIWQSAGKPHRLGRLYWDQPSSRLNPDSELPVVLSLDLDYAKLREIEKIREGGELNLYAELRFVSEVHQNPLLRSPVYIRVMNIRIPKSDWVESILPALRFKDFFLLEFPRLTATNFGEVPKHMNDAWKQYSAGEYDKVLIQCRKALEESNNTLKKEGFVKEIDENGTKKDVPDWERLLGSDNVGEAVGKITQKMFGVLAPASHAGKAINRADAEFALMVTSGLISLATNRLQSASPA